MTIDTLRHYDALGLLKPAKVDPATGYRYYSAKQLQPLNRILALKEVGFSLDEIARILQEKLTDDELRGMLKAQLVQAESDLEAVQLRMERIVTRLNHLKESDMPAYEVTLKPVEAHTVAAIREIVPEVEQVPQRCFALFNMIADWMKANQLPFGPPLTTYYNEGYARENIDLECAFIIPDQAAVDGIMPAEPIAIRQMEAIPHAATAIVTDDFHGKLDGLSPAYNAIAQWIEDHNYQIVGPPREFMHGSPETGDLTAEIQFPVEKL
ncbi:MAG: MerR family transcriptional regulator [Anaerolineales bacterium]|nr:MerR family transcriptional regulator [Anaerolineales bacterium]